MLDLGTFYTLPVLLGFIANTLKFKDILDKKEYICIGRESEELLKDIVFQYNQSLLISKHIEDFAGVYAKLDI